MDEKIMDEKIIDEKSAGNKNYTVSRETGALILLGSAVAGLITVWLAYQGRELRRSKRSAKREVLRTDADLYEKKDRKKIRKLSDRSLKKIEKARNQRTVRSAKDAFDDSIEGFRTRKGKLADAKLDAITEAYEQLLKEKGGLRAADTEVLTDAAREYAESVRDAASVDQIRKLQKEFHAEAGTRR